MKCAVLITYSVSRYPLSVTHLGGVVNFKNLLNLRPWV